MSGTIRNVVMHTSFPASLRNIETGKEINETPLAHYDDDYEEISNNSALE